MYNNKTYNGPATFQFLWLIFNLPTGGATKNQVSWAEIVARDSGQNLSVILKFLNFVFHVNVCVCLFPVWNFKQLHNFPLELHFIENFPVNYF